MARESEQSNYESTLKDGQIDYKEKEWTSN